MSPEGDRWQQEVKFKKLRRLILRKNRILLIEDNPDHADLIINALNDEEAGNGDKDVFLINDGQDAIDYFYKNDLPENACSCRYGLVV